MLLFGRSQVVTFLHPPMSPVIINILSHIPFYAYALGMVYLANLFYQRTSDFSFLNELTERDNPAFGACFAGYLLGVAVALTGAFPDDVASWGDAAITMTYSGLLAILLMRVSIWINDKLILNRFSIQTEMIRDRNVGAGAAVAGSSIGTGLVLAGALSGESEGVFNAIRDIVVYWAVGQALFIAGAAAFYKTAGYNVQETLENDNNAAAGISLGGFLIALGILVWSTLHDASGNLLDELQVTAILVVIGGPLLLLTSILTEKLILPRINLAKEIAIDKNSAAGLICAAASVSTALLLAALITSH